MSSSFAETYHRVSELQFEGGKRLVERLGVKEGSHVLDVGCGTGRLAHWLAERVGTNGGVLGIDPQEDRVQLARSQGGTARFEVGRAEDLSAFEDQSFDFVCMSSVLHWVDEKAKALSEVHRVLRPGGRLGVTTSPHELFKVSTIGRALERIDHSQLSFAKHRASTTELISLVVESGLELVELHVAPHSRVHESGEALLDFIDASSFGTFLGPVPEDLRGSLRGELISAFEAQRTSEGIVSRGFGLVFIARALHPLTPTLSPPGEREQ